MLKSIERLLHSWDDLTVGNHSSIHIASICFYRYHGTAICEANYSRKEFKLPYNGKYAHSVPTRRAVNDYKRYFLGKGFTLTEEAIQDR